MTPIDEYVRELLARPRVRGQAPYRLARVFGPDAVDFLQRLCSQDVAAMAPGDVRPGAFLDGKGKLQATCLLARTDATLWLETQAHQQATLLALLDRYHFTEKLRFEAVDSACSERVAAAAGPDAAAQASHGADGAIELRFARRGIAFRRRHEPPGGGAAPLLGEPLDDDTAECLRMIAGLVKVGVESEPATLALEADLDDHVSTTKGCFTGQEIVARIHTYGHTNRALCLLQLAAGSAITAPQTLHEPADGVAVGRVMHAVPAPGRTMRVGLGYLPKDFQAPGTELRLADGTAVTVARAAGNA
jgi:folate-binding protein YgfZ